MMKNKILRESKNEFLRNVFLRESNRYDFDNRRRFFKYDEYNDMFEIEINKINDEFLRELNEYDFDN